MRTDLLGLELDCALDVLRREGVSADVSVTSAPARAQQTRGTLRVVYAADDGTRLTAARFLDPIAEQKEEIDG